MTYVERKLLLRHGRIVLILYLNLDLARTGCSLRGCTANLTRVMWQGLIHLTVYGSDTIVPYLYPVSYIRV